MKRQTASSFPVDLLAKEAALYETSTAFKIHYTDLRQSAKTNAMKNTRENISITVLTKGVEFFKFYQNNSKPWFYNTNISQSAIVMINRARSNHYNLNASLSRVGMTNDPSCSCGNPYQDLYHILLQCSNYDNQRGKLIANLAKLHPYLPLSSRSILDKPTRRLTGTIHSFLISCDIKI